ncbi:MAG: Omp28-related outer membrane protein [Saprospirales bacterium]|nr:Omp28-related outer membrane protein [Saprospirales bacterium]MBK8489784.1 Omp28-related outer membrane protein [Saprospirales bacterium]
MKRLFTLFLAMGLGLSLSAQVFFNETFEGGSLPAGWTITTAATDGGWVIGSASDLSSSSFPIPNNGGLIAVSNDDGCNCNKANDVLVLPAVDLSSVSDLVLVFDAFFLDDTYQGVAENAQVVYSLDGGTTWTTLFELGGSNAWQNITVDLAPVLGNSSVKLGFRYSDNSGWLYGFGVDNILVYKPYDYDVKLTLNPVNRFNLLNSNIGFSGTIANNGLLPVTSLDISWTDGTNTYTDNLSGLNIAPGGTYNFTHGTQLDVASAITYNIDVTAANPNGQPDGYDINNSASAKVSGLSFVPARRMVGEEATGTWCGWCPRGFVYMEQMDQDHEDFIGIAVHNGDPITNATYDDGLGNFPGFSGYPSVIVDRATIVDPSEMEDYYNATMDRIVPAAASIVDALVDPATRDLTINVAATFATQLSSADYRFNIVLVENGITGTGSGYNQANYYSSQANNIPLTGYYGFNWQTLPNPVPAAQMVYDIVGRDILGGWDGWDGTQNVNADDVVTGSYSYTIPAAWNYENMFVVFMVLDGNTGEILNADEREIWTTSTTEIDNLQRFTLSPNPTTGYATLNLQLEKAADVRVEVLNTVGQTLIVQQADNSFGGLFQFNLGNQAAGTYFVKATVGDQVRVERLIIAK